MDWLSQTVYAVLVIIIGFFINFFSSYIYKHFFKNKISARRDTILLLTMNVIRYTVLGIVVIVIAYIYDVDTTSLLAGAGILGILLGLALQKLLQDMINGFFIIFEDQYVVGEYVTINNVTGEVLEIGLKTTKIKTYEGELHLFSNGNINQIANHSRFPSLCLVEFPISYKYDVYQVLEVIKKYSKEFRHKNIISKLDVVGVSSVFPNYYVVRVVCYVKSYEHFEISRLLNAYITSNLMQENIIIDDIKMVNIQSN